MTAGFGAKVQYTRFRLATRQAALRTGAAAHRHYEDGPKLPVLRAQHKVMRVMARDRPSRVAWSFPPRPARRAMTCPWTS